MATDDQLLHNRQQTDVSETSLSEASHAVVFAGALPPPVTGMTVMTEAIVERLRDNGPVLCLNWSRGKAMKGWKWKAARIWGALRTFLALLRRGRRQSATFYYPASSSLGLFYDIVLVATARLLKYRVVLHHHCYSYINRPDWRMRLIVRLMSQNDAHVVHCEQMQNDLLKSYQIASQFVFVPPTIVSQQMERVESARDATFTLGFLSNLVMAKGLDEAVLTFERLQQRGRSVRLVLAGPCMGDREQQFVQHTLGKWGDVVEYRGPVYGKEKAQFFADIDVLLFPTRYENESWGIVLTEALAVGVPVAARSRGCVPWIIQGDCGLVVPADGDFVSAASNLIQEWLRDDARYANAVAAAGRRSSELEADAARQLPDLIDFIWRRGASS